MAGEMGVVSDNGQSGNGRAPTLEVADLKKHFPVSGRFGGSSGLVYAVDGVSFSIDQGEVLGLVGESGSG